MPRYAGQKRRATTSKTYAMDMDYKKCITDAKRIHRYDCIFYIYLQGKHYTSISYRDYQTNEKYHSIKGLEHWYFRDGFWHMYVEE